ncbi:MAG: hypothetical protein P4L81_06680 [Candidatus Pacebacteria bacterium]|nr:hypothetical protein [Candidatus Paceibacterota bacterium]
MPLHSTKYLCSSALTGIGLENLRKRGWIFKIVPARKPPIKRLRQINKRERSHRDRGTAQATRVVARNRSGEIPD